MLFCHITTHVDGDPHQDLLSKKGGMGFPHVVVLDAEGNVQATLAGARNAKGFAATVTKAQANITALKDLAARADKGDAEAAVQLFEKQLSLSHLTPAVALERLAKLKGVDADNQQKLQGQIAKAEVMGILGAIKDEKGQIGAGEQMATMLEAGRIPPEGQEQMYFWLLIGAYANDKRDTALLDKAIAGVKAMKRPQAQMVKRLEAMREKLGDKAEPAGDGKK